MARQSQAERARLLPAAAGLLLAVMGTQPAQAQNAASTVAVGGNPSAIAVNPLTNKIYVEIAGDNVAVIDGATNGFTTVAEGSDGSLALNPVTGNVYISNGPFSGILSPEQVTVLDGATNATNIIAPGSAGPIAVNPVTNKIYVSTLNGVTVIDGTTNATTGIAVTSPGPIAVNPVTNKIYVANGLYSGSPSTSSLTVIDGATNLSAVLAVGFAGPIAVNSVTNKIYVVNLGYDEVMEVDGATNAITTVGLGSNPSTIALNPVTNMVYVGSFAGDSVTAIDGATYATTTIPVGANPQAITVNPVTNEVYVLNAENVTVIDGITNATSTVAVGTSPQGIAVNPVTGDVYVANNGSADVTVIGGAGAAPAPPTARLTNISVRAQVGTGGDILIPGFVVAGGGTETLLIRGAGPGLAQYGVPGVLASPTLSLLDGAGAVIASNTGWGTNANPAQIAASSAQVGAFAFASGSADCALIASLPAGSYTVQVSGAGGTTGVALAEVYEISSSGTRLVNISSRAQVGTGANIIIPGFVVSGTGKEDLLLRADGPALSQFGVTGVLAQPGLSLIDASGDLIASNAGWTSADIGLIAGFDAAVGAFALSPGSADSAQVVGLAPGAYTMQVSGQDGATGLALAEIYEAP
jgi:DNA-binding beta-propeller fold protein YncE